MNTNAGTIDNTYHTNFNDMYLQQAPKINPLFRLFTLESLHRNKVQRDASREKKRQLKLIEEEKKKAALLRRKKFLLKSTQHLFQPTANARPSLEIQQRSLLQLPLTTLMVPTLIDQKSRTGPSDVECLFPSKNNQQQGEGLQKEKNNDNKSDSEDEGAKPNPLLESGRSLPKRFGEFPRELFGKPVEELDEYYVDKNTFVVVARDKTIYRFSASSGLFLLSPFNPIRRCAIYILTHPVFSLLVMLVILVNCVFMAANQEIPSSEAVFTGIYTVESLIKILARGFIMARFTYLRDAWNWLDFIVVSLAYITLAFPMGNLAALRTFRVLRALKTVAVVPGLKTIVGALMEAVRRLRDVIILTLFVLSIFALVGLQIYQGTLLNKCVLIPDWMIANQSEEVTWTSEEHLLLVDNISFDSVLEQENIKNSVYNHLQDDDDKIDNLLEIDKIRLAGVYRLQDGDVNISRYDVTVDMSEDILVTRTSLIGDDDDDYYYYSKSFANATDIHMKPATGSSKSGESSWVQRLINKISKSPYNSLNDTHLAGHRSYLDHINNQSNWILLPNGTPKICGNGSGMGSCPANYWCLPAGHNPNFGYTNFDNFGFALLCAFRLMTQDCWEVLYQMVLTANGPYHIVFFIIVIFMGSFYLVNLILAIVAMSYDDCQKQELLEEEEDEAENNDDDDDDDGGGGDNDDELMMLRRLDDLDMGLDTPTAKTKKDSISCPDDYNLPLKLADRIRQSDSPSSSIKTEYALMSAGSNLSGTQDTTEHNDEDGDKDGDRNGGQVSVESCGLLMKKKTRLKNSITIEISDCSLKFADDDEITINVESKSTSNERNQTSSSSTPSNPRQKQSNSFDTNHPLQESHKFISKNYQNYPQRSLRLSKTFGDTLKSSSLSSDQFSIKRSDQTPSVHLQPPAHFQPRHSSWDGLPVIFHHHAPSGSQKRLVDKMKAAHRASLRRQSLRLRRASVEACLHKTTSSSSIGCQNFDGKPSHRSVFEPTHFLWTGTKLQMDTRGSKKLDICPKLTQSLLERRKECEVEEEGCRSSECMDEDNRPCIEYNDLRLLQSFLHDTKKGLTGKPPNLKRYLEEKCYQLFFGWQCCPAWQRFASLVELFIMDAFVDLFITLCIVVNTVFMALDHEGMSTQLAQVLAIGNYVFTAIFTFEAAMKIMALGLQQYLRDRWSCFDLVIVVLSLVELGLANVKGLSILRSFRLLRVFKLAKSWPTLNLLIGIIGRTMGALGNLCFVLAIIIFIFAVMGMQLFGEDYTVERFGEVPRWNFCDFLHSFMIVFRVLCGEWIESMWNCIFCSGLVCIPFFLLTMIIGNLVVLNLFLALLLSSFGAESLQGGANQDDGEINKLQEAVDRLTRFCRFVKSHLLVCIYHRMKRGGRRKYTPVYRKIDLDGKIWFEDTLEEEIDDKMTCNDPSHSNEEAEDANIPMIKIVGESCNGTSNQKLTVSAEGFKPCQKREVVVDAVEKPHIQNSSNNSNGADDDNKLWSFKSLKFEEDNLISADDTLVNKDESYKKLRQHSLSTSSGCNISTPSCADQEELVRSESLANIQNNIETNKNLSLVSDSTPSSNFKGYETEATAETSGNDLSDNISSTSDEALLAENIFLKSLKDIEQTNEDVDNVVNKNTSKNNSPSSPSSLSSDGAFMFDANKTLTQQQQQKQLNYQQYLLTLEATEVEIEYISYPDDCCPVCLTRRCCCCCPKWWHTTARRARSSKVGTFLWRTRTSCFAMVEHKIFETFIIFMIICSSLTLAVEDKNIDKNPPLKKILKILDKAFSIIFVFEMVIKLTAYGFKKYFTDAWCWLDFVIVAISMVSLAAEGVGMGNIGAFRALRTLRALRPLRAVSRWEGMKVVVNALIQAIPAICNVLLVCLVFWLIFSIMGVNLFGSRFGRCVDKLGQVVNSTLVANKTQCLEMGGWDTTNMDTLKMEELDQRNLTWLNPKINFDHVLIAYLALFQIATFKGWTDIMNYAIDSKEPGLQPETEIRVYMYLYFVFFIVFGSFFTLNLFIGVIIDNFNMQKRKSGSQQLFMTEDQKKYYNAMKKLGSKQPQKPVPKPRLRCSLLLFHLVSNQKFDVAIMIAILINMFTMAVEHYEQSHELSYVLTKVNQVFIAIFTVECLMKMIALRHYYFKQPWNIFDFIVVVLSILAPATNEIIEKYFFSPTLLRVVRVFRVGRILRLVKSAKGIRTLLFSLAVSLPALVNIGLLLFLIMFIYAIFGMSFFMNVKHNAGIEELFNFETFFRSITLLFQISTSAGWDSVLAGLMIEPPFCEPHQRVARNNYIKLANGTMLEQSTLPQSWIQATLNINPNDFIDDEDRPMGDCGHSGLAVLYLVSYLVVSYLVVINMYIAVILENFSQATDDIRQGLTQDDFDMYYEVWEKFDEKATQFIPLEMMGQFVDALEHPLCLPTPNRCKLVSLNIPICEGDKVHCLDILDALTKNFLGTSGDMGGELAKLKASIGYKPVTTTLIRRRDERCAIIIQKAWKAYRKKSKGPFGNKRSNY